MSYIYRHLCGILKLVVAHVGYVVPNARRPPTVKNDPTKWSIHFSILSLYLKPKENGVIRDNPSAYLVCYAEFFYHIKPLQWRHNGRDGVSNHQRLDCLLKEKNQNSALLAFVRGIHRWPVDSLHKGPVTRKMFPFDDVIMNTHSQLGSTSSCT